MPAHTRRRKEFIASFHFLDHFIGGLGQPLRGLVTTGANAAYPSYMVNSTFNHEYNLIWLSS